MASNTPKTKRSEIIDLLRGRYATPVLSSLDRLGVLDALQSSPCTPDDFPTLSNKSALTATLDYLVAIGLLHRLPHGAYTPSDLGRHVLPRAGSASIMESYDRYFSLLPDILTTPTARSDRDITVCRPVNIHGSGRMHRTKFFPKAFALYKQINPVSLIDLGCGDGTFLQEASADISAVRRITGVDLSPESTAAMKDRLSAAIQTTGSDAEIASVTCDAFDVAAWSQAIPQPQGPEIISAWFVLHEFSGGSADRIIGFLRDLHRYRPGAHVVIGELVLAAPDVMAQNRDKTIMPEFLLFHALSGQAPLDWPTWQDIATKIPYRLQTAFLFDSIESQDGPIPSNFIWALAPA